MGIVLQGGPGVGKTHLIDELVVRASADMPVYRIKVSADSADPQEDYAARILEELSTDLQEGDALDPAKAMRAFKQALTKRALIVLEDFEYLLHPKAGNLTHLGRSLVESIGVATGPCKVLVEVARLVEDVEWIERFDTARLDPPGDGEAQNLLQTFLKDKDVEPLDPVEVGPISHWLGRNPRAMLKFASARMTVSLGELISIQELGYEDREAHGTPELLQRIESILSSRIIDSLGEEAARLLTRLSIYRRPLEGNVLADLAPDVPNTIPAREELVKRYVLERRLQKFQLAPMIRELVLAKTPSDARKSLHAAAGEYYLRPFTNRRPDDTSTLAAAYMEARYHWTHAEQPERLRPASEAMIAAIRKQISYVSPLPTDPHLRDEQIAMLLPIAEDLADPEVCYYLAKLLRSRGVGDDLDRGAAQARIACERDSRGYHDVWLVLASLMGDLAKADEVLAEGISRIKPEHNLFALYQERAHILEKMDDLAKADDVLAEGISRLKPENNLFSLYQERAHILEKMDDLAKADDVLAEGISRLKPEHNLYSLYQERSRVLEKMERVEDADELLTAGVEAIGPHQFSGHRLAETQILLRTRHGWLDKLGASLPAFPTPLRELASAWLRAAGGDWNGALSESVKALDTSPAYTAARALATLALLGLGRRAEALAMATGSHWGIEPGKNEAGAWVLAIIYLRLGDNLKVQEMLAHIPAGSDQPPTTQTLRMLWELDPTVNPIRHHFPLVPGGLLGPEERRPDFVPSPTNPQTPVHKHRTRLRVLAVATEWFSWHGGLSTFNRDMCREMVKLGHDVVCYVPTPSAEEREDAEKAGLRLVEIPDGNATQDELVRRPPIGDWIPEVVLGHDRQTGHQAKVLRDEQFTDARRVHFIHTSPGQIEWYKDLEKGGTNADSRVEAQVEHCRGADLVAAVGPRLRKSIEDALAARGVLAKVDEFIPGFRRSAKREAPPNNRAVLLVGRAEDVELKGLDIAAEAMSRVRKRYQRVETELRIRGVAPESAKELTDHLRMLVADDDLVVRAQPYLANEERVGVAMREAFLMIMPSREEGFGLVGLEAIASGTPVLISSQSGLAEALAANLPEDAMPFIVPTSDSLETSADEWERRIGAQLNNPLGAYRETSHLAAKLKNVFDWEIAVDNLFVSLLGT